MLFGLLFVFWSCFKCTSKDVGDFGACSCGLVDFVGSENTKSWLIIRLAFFFFEGIIRLVMSRAITLKSLGIKWKGND